MSFSEVLDELKTRIGISKVKVKFWFIEYEFDRTAFLQLPQIYSTIEILLRKLFIDRQIMWMDLTKEVPEYCLKSLEDMAELLDEKIESMSGKLSRDDSPVVVFLHEWRTACISSFKSLRRKRDEAEEHNTMTFGMDERIYPHEYISEVIKEFRLNTYPIVRAFIDMLEENNQTQKEALRIWYQGRKILEEEEKDKVVPQWKIAT